MFLITICFCDLFYSGLQELTTNTALWAGGVPLNMVLGDLRGLIIKYPFARWGFKGLVSCVSIVVRDSLLLVSASWEGVVERDPVLDPDVSA